MPDESPNADGELVGGQIWEVDGEPSLHEPAPEEAIDLPPPEPDPEPVVAAAEVAPPPPERILEALLFVGGEPLGVGRACEVIRGLPPDQFREMIDRMNRRYRRQNRPYLVRESEAGFLLEVRPALRAVRERMFGSPREARLNPAAVDVAALVAYQQPIAKSEIDALRGTDSAAAIRQLVRLGLIAVNRRGEAKHQEVFYGTTGRFLEVFGLRSLDELPKIGEVKQVD